MLCFIYVYYLYISIISHGDIKALCNDGDKHSYLKLITIVHIEHKEHWHLTEFKKAGKERNELRTEWESDKHLFYNKTSP